MIITIIISINKETDLSLVKNYNWIISFKILLKFKDSKQSEKCIGFSMEWYFVYTYVGIRFMVEVTRIFNLMNGLS